MIRNYQKELDALIEEKVKNQIRPTLLLHSCCAPCSSYVLSYLQEYFEITLFYYNPNISPIEEYHKRVEEQKRLLEEFKQNGITGQISFLEGAYEPHRFKELSKNLEALPEGGERCFKCYALRLNETAKQAAKGGFDYFTTTLSISPHKNAVKLNEIGEAAGVVYGIPYLVSDFKKKSGYQQSILFSKEYGLYRQDYCGCEYSKKNRADTCHESMKLV
ncbi:MAG: epoxyqueuosine reductase QueH [Clostridia bacterium]|nr:epoxyqueuosine reductase QueH [Clostridia bacterium]